MAEEQDNNNTLLSEENSNNIFFEDVEGEQGKSLVLEPSQKLTLVGTIQDRFSSAETARIPNESRWLDSYRNYRGHYNSNIKFRASEKSRIFVKITKTKVLAAFGQLVDVIFGTGKFPIGVSETKMPEGVSEFAHLDIQNPVPGIETTPPEEEVKKQQQLHKKILLTLVTKEMEEHLKLAQHLLTESL